MPALGLFTGTRVPSSPGDRSGVTVPWGGFLQWLASGSLARVTPLFLRGLKLSWLQPPGVANLGIPPPTLV